MATRAEDDGIPKDLKEWFAEVRYTMPFTVIYICGVWYATHELPQGARRVDCTCVADEPYQKTDKCKGMLQNFVWLADRIHEKRSNAEPAAPIWVNCEHGQVRSVLTVGIFLIRRGGLSVDQTMDILRRSRGERWGTSPNYAKVKEWLLAYVALRGEIQAEPPAAYDDH